MSIVSPSRTSASDDTPRSTVGREAEVPRKVRERLTRGRWRKADGGRQMAEARRQKAEGKWQMADGRWQSARGYRDNLIIWSERRLSHRIRRRACNAVVLTLPPRECPAGAFRRCSRR